MNRKKISILSASLLSGGGAFNTNSSDFSLKQCVDHTANRAEYPKFPIENYVSKNRDLVNMSPSQKMLVFSAGEALSALEHDDNDRRSMNIYVSCACGERGELVDQKVFEAYLSDVNINEELCNLRPNHLLTFLPNLFSANVSMIYGLEGDSITFIGESHGSISAVDYCFMNSQLDSSFVALVGGVFNGDQEIFDEYVSINRAKNEYSCLKFGSASASILVCNSNSKYSESKIADLTHIGQIDIDFFDGINTQDIELIIFSHAFSQSSELFDCLAKGPFQTVNITQYLGNLFEASLQAQIFVGLKYDEKIKRVLIVTEISRGIYWAYLLEKDSF